MNEIEKLQALVEELQQQLKARDEEIEVLTVQGADYTKQIEEFQVKVNTLEETNILKSKKISDLLLNSASVIDKIKGVDETTQEENEEVRDLDEIIGGI